MYLGRIPDKTSFVYINARLLKNQTRIECELNDNKSCDKDYYNLNSNKTISYGICRLVSLDVLNKI